MLLAMAEAQATGGSIAVNALKAEFLGDAAIDKRAQTLSCYTI